ncbi:hypothetical protein [Sulfurovum sp.]|uniref:hypothetical protein n=1 Tax=Sulfurovum sp. TaxID=1969726 RepID=UPI00184A387D|nr:hypothetical protein [Sulfurovum sp.]HFU77217.1 hypothetical protein [Campylobacterota bacterium]
MKYTVLSLSALFIVGCGNGSQSVANQKENYIQNLEKDNNISYDKIINTRASYITSMCYTKTKDEHTGVVFNPCYSCHTKGKIPNYFNDTNLQKEYSFPVRVLKNPFRNLFKDRTQKVSGMNDEQILNYIRVSNYLDTEGSIILQKTLPSDWKGYKPDCYYNFDEKGFDKDLKGNFTGWRAFRYYPFLGTFWPTNGSTDDVLIRLDKPFTYSRTGEYDQEVYTLNLSVVEALVKQKDIVITGTDEQKFGVDLNGNGVLDNASFVSKDVKSYVGKAKNLLESGQVHLAKGLFPENTEFLHSVRYVDWDDNTSSIRLSQRIKELRYAKKTKWLTYSNISRVASAELWEAQLNGTTQGEIASFRGNYEEGLRNNLGWKYQGFIEDLKGTLRPQTHEETIGCMGCHSHLGATTDSIFSFSRKLEGTSLADKMYGWNHWSQKGLKGIPEPKTSYLNRGEKYEYSFYLTNNHSGNEFRNNSEVQKKFFDENGVLKPEMIQRLHQDISILLFPSKKRALTLNKGYKALVEEQSYIYGRDANVKPMDNVYRDIQEGQSTNIVDTVVQQ